MVQTAEKTLLCVWMSDCPPALADKPVLECGSSPVPRSPSASSSQKHAVTGAAGFTVSLEVRQGGPSPSPSCFAAGLLILLPLRPHLNFRAVLWSWSQKPAGTLLGAAQDVGGRWPVALTAAGSRPAHAPTCLCFFTLPLSLHRCFLVFSVQILTHFS